MRFLFLTMDGNHGAALRQAASQIHRDHDIDIHIVIHNATTLRGEEALSNLSHEIARSDFVFGSMLFGEDLVRPLDKILSQTTTPVCIITSNPTLIRCTAFGKFALAKSDDEPGLVRKWLNKIRPKKSGHGEGRRQLQMLRNLGKIMKLIPGKLTDIHTYIAVHDYWMHGSPENLRRMLVMFIARYMPTYEGQLDVEDPIHYPETAIYHPDAPEPFPDLESYSAWRGKRQWKGSVGLLSLRTVILSGNTAHMDALIRSIESEGVEVRAAYSAGLDFRPAIDQFYTNNQIDVLLNGAGFSLVGGMAESRPDDAREALEKLDIGYLDMIPLAFQKIEEWQQDDMGLSPIQLAMNIAIPELDGATEPLVYGGPTHGQDQFVPLDDQVGHAAQRITRRVRLHQKKNAEKRVGVVLFNFPPNLGNAGTAAYLDVFESVHTLLNEMKAHGYTVDVPATPEELRERVVQGNAVTYGTQGNVGARLPVDTYRQVFPDYVDIEPMWGYAPGELLTDGHDFYILGQFFGNVFVGLQPGFGYERDPMRMLMAKDAAPNHGFAAFYTWLEHIFDADALLHFGTHGALEFMPGKQAGLSQKCWPTRLLGSLPNFYYYSVNNPSEATIAKRRSAATLVSYMVPPLEQAGLYKGLRILKDSINAYREKPSQQAREDLRLQAEKLGITVEDDENYVASLSHELIQVEHRMIPMGLHELGKPPQQEELVDMLALVAIFTAPIAGMPTLPQTIAEAHGWDYKTIRETLKTDERAQDCWDYLDRTVREAMRLLVTAPHTPDLQTGAINTYLAEQANIAPLDALWHHLDDLLGRIVDEREIEGLINALDGRYIPPSPANDVVRNVGIVPTGRNIHGLDPFNVPTLQAHVAGEALVSNMLIKLTAENDRLPETIAMILWGTDNLKSDCEGVAQVLALVGARATRDELGNVADVELIPLEELGRPRIDVVVTVSGIFRDLLNHQMNLLNKAVLLAANADEPDEMNFVRKHTRTHATNLDVPFDDAATRIFSNRPGHYGANVNHLVESSNWEEDDELSEAFLTSKSYSIGTHGEWHDARHVMEESLATAEAAFQNIDSFEIGISDIDHYYEYLGGVAKSVEKMTGKRPPVLVADAMAISDRISSLEQMVRLESRAKLLNPKWYEAMLNHGYEGVREIETRVSNTYGWSATTDAVEGWVYDDIAGTFLLDKEMRDRLSKANPHATAAIARRLMEAHARSFWDADETTIDQLQQIYCDLEDRLEGIQGD